ncbi:MAG: urease accessory protein UreE [Caldimonas sp.]
MLTVNKLIPAGSGLAPVLLRRAASIELDWDTRQKSRFDATDSQGRELGVFLPRGQVVRGGDVLVCEDGSLLAVKAKAQPVMVVTACPDHGSPLDLVRAAYHLGNRHVSLEVRPTRLQLEPDHVLGDMLRRMGLHVDETAAPFEPEAGAYDSPRPIAAHGHEPDPARGREHGHDHDHAGHSHP